MTYRIEYLDLALGDAAQIKAYMSKFYEHTWDKFAARLEKQLLLLRESPYIYEVYKERPQFRKMTVGDYLVFYTVDDNIGLVSIARILRGSRDIETAFT